jgi:hypothetical protein
MKDVIQMQRRHNDQPLSADDKNVLSFVTGALFMLVFMLAMNELCRPAQHNAEAMTPYVSQEIAHRE